MRARLRRLVLGLLLVGLSTTVPATAPALASCSSAAVHAYGATYGSNCMCSSCTVFCNTPRGPYKNGTCC